MHRFSYAPGLAAIATVACILLAACGQAPLSQAVPPTATPVFPPGYETPTPIPPEHRRFFVGMGDGANGVPAIQPRGSLSDTRAMGITKADVERYASTHEMHGELARISYVGPQPIIVGIELVELVEVYRRYMPEALLSDWEGPYPPETQVYVVELRGRFRFTGGPAPGYLGTYRTGVWVFDAHTGYDILEGGVGRIDPP